MSLSIPFAGGGATPPTSLNAVRAVGSSSITTDVFNAFGAQVTADVTSATLTEVLNISGKGILQFLMLNGNSSTTIITNPKIRIVIDGIEVTNATIPNVSSTRAGSVVGAYNGGASEQHGTHDAIAFNSSLVVEIASDGTNNVRLAYKRYLT